MRPLRKMGHFTLTSDALENEELARAIYRDMIVYKVENDVATGIVDVWALHPNFKVEAPEGRPVIEYYASIEQTPQGKYTVTWRS